MTLLHTYIGHDLISRTVSLHTPRGQKIYCNVLIKLYHTTAHHRKKQKRKNLSSEKSKHIFVCSRRLKTISRILTLILEKKKYPTFILINIPHKDVGIYQVYPFPFLGVQCIKKHCTVGYGYIC